ncbi:flagellar hook-associated protein FlgK [Maritimibacter sp. HL-12]|uniref:flagellar hook-associated protein FlgK n=1 Tax=Maritimibacter sp. HL-12 TaxID=1162418 RepID=UPI000A0F0333|nr:flagellar hook-associated protein FlgK [Maritimibacter sp. HL-12]SMH43191.1 flagellar hook-associated protein 1 FlgK [Maritimibacter sp. HL-12]
MTIAGSLANALSGLTASSRAAELVSSNVANAMTEGYGRRELQLQPRYMGDGSPSGVNVTGVRREVDMVIVQDRRLADAAAGNHSELASFHAQMEGVVGLPDDQNSLSGRIAAFEASLIEAASRPDNPARLDNAVRAAQDIAEHLNTASREVQSSRMRADAAIDAQVRQLNDGLLRVQNLNSKIKETTARGQDPSALMDQRQQAIDALSPIIPLRQVERDHGMIALYTSGGAIVLDGRAAELDFQQVGVIVPEMTQASGALSGLTINGYAVRTGGDRSPIGGGSLAALFEIRDDLATNMQSQLDAVARDLIERFQDAGLDASRAPGDAGLLTDAGQAFSVADETGLASRISVNSLVLADAGGDSWRLRDGLGAAVPGEVGNASLLQEIKSALLAPRIAASGGFHGVQRSASGLVADLLSSASAARVDAEARQSHAAAQKDSLAFMEMQAGVDTDHELQKLMLIEQAYAANAKVISTVSAMLDAVMEL